MILFIRTDTMDATVGLMDGARTIETHTWPAGRQLSGQLLGEIRHLLSRHQLDWPDLAGIIVFAGPGSFTGLRIGVSVANAIGYSLNIPVAGSQGESWTASGLTMLAQTTTFTPARPEYGKEVHITLPKRSSDQVRG